MDIQQDLKTDIERDREFIMKAQNSPSIVVFIFVIFLSLAFVLMFLVFLAIRKG